MKLDRTPDARRFTDMRKRPPAETGEPGSTTIPMATNVSRAEKRTDRSRVRPDYIFLGVDARGAHQIYDTTTETVHIIHDDGSRGRRLLDAGDVDDYMAAVRDAHGWEREHYGVLLVDELARRVKSE